MTNILVVWSLGGFGFCINGNLFTIFALQNQEASVPIPYSNMEAQGQSLATRPSNHRDTPWPGSPYRWPILSVIGSDTWEVHPQMELSLVCCFHLLPILRILKIQTEVCILGALQNKPKFWFPFKYLKTAITSCLSQAFTFHPLNARSPGRFIWSWDGRFLGPP